MGSHDWRSGTGDVKLFYVKKLCFTALCDLTNVLKGKSVICDKSHCLTFDFVCYFPVEQFNNDSL